MSVDTTSVGFGLLAPLLHALAWGERPNIDVPFPDTKDFHTLCLGGEGAVQVRTTHRVGVLAHVRSSVVGFTYVGLLYDSGTPGTDDARSESILVLGSNLRSASPPSICVSQSATP